MFRILRFSPRVENASVNFTLLLATLNERTLPFPKKALVESEPETIRKGKTDTRYQ